MALAIDRTVSASAQHLAAGRGRSVAQLTARQPLAYIIVMIIVAVGVVVANIWAAMQGRDK